MGTSTPSSSRLRLQLILLLQLQQDLRHLHRLRATRQLVVDIDAIVAQLGGLAATSGQLTARLSGRGELSPFSTSSSPTSPSSHSICPVHLSTCLRKLPKCPLLVPRLTRFLDVCHLYSLVQDYVVCINNLLKNLLNNNL